MSLTPQSPIQHIPDWSYSFSGHNIELSTSAPQSPAPILWIGGVHGDEPEGVWLAQYTLQWLQEWTQEGQQLHPWALIPCLNPDGLSKAQRTNGNGVDINRNFPERNWTKYHTAPRYFPGPHPQSEPETQSLVKLIDQIQPQIIVHCHSWKPCVVLTGDHGAKGAKYLSESTGYEFQHDIGYPTPGSLGEYGWNEKKIPVICIEVEEGLAKEKLPSLFKKGIHRFFTEAIL